MKPKSNAMNAHTARTEPTMTPEEARSNIVFTLWLFAILAVAALAVQQLIVAPSNARIGISVSP